MDVVQALLREADWLRQQIEIKDRQLELLWRENELLRGRNKSLELTARRTYDISTQRLRELAGGSERGIDGGVGQDPPPESPEVVYIQPGQVPPRRVLPLGPALTLTPVPRGGDAPVLEVCAELDAARLD